jgi:DNA (cytosine-5)-methyltransferase 1
MLRTVELFVGMGGITHALRGISHPVVYCEAAPHCIQLLTKLMTDGKIPTAPIWNDVATLDGTKYRDIDMIAGGFPCVGMSVAGHQQGFQNEQTGLFGHVLRLIDQIRPKIVFLENVAAITSGGSLEIVCATLSQRGYNARWVVLPAYALGPAPHVRKRWFCLAYAQSRVAHIKDLNLRPWKPVAYKEPAIPRMVLHPGPNNLKRLMMLGNAVVPDVVRAAFIALWTASDDFKKVPRLTTAKFAKTTDLFSRCLRGTITKVPSPEFARPNLDLLLDPAAVPRSATPNKAISTPLVTRVLKLSLWATPRHGNNGGCQTLTARSKDDLPTQVRFEKSTPNELRRGTLNADWVDWMMGFPSKWSRY